MGGGRHREVVGRERERREGRARLRPSPALLELAEVRELEDDLTVLTICKKK